MTAINAAQIIRQWTDVHGLSETPSRTEIVDGHPRRVWENAQGEEVIEDYLIEGMDHGAPIAVSTGDKRHGAAGPYLLDVGISSSYHIAKFWGVTAEEPAPALLPAEIEEVEAAPAPAPHAETWLQRLRAGIHRALQVLGVRDRGR